MEHLDHIVRIISLSMGAAWASGINLYAAILTLGILGATGQMTLPADLQILTAPIVMIAAAVMFCVEFFADKVPGMDTGWDAVHSFIRIPGGALLAAGAVGDVNPAVMIAAGILGGGLAAGTHAAKAGSRVLINTSPEPFSNWLASLGEDIAVIAGVWAALVHPWVFLTCLVVFIILLIWLLPKLWRGIKAVFARLTSLFRRTDVPTTPAEAGDAPVVSNPP
jgi:hypothetical protein